MGPFETQVEVLNEGLFSVVKKLVGRLFAPLTRKVREIKQVGNSLSLVGRLWLESERESGEKLPVSTTMRKAKSLSSIVDRAFSEVSDLPESKLDYDESYPVNEALTLTTIIGLALGIIGGIPIILKTLQKLASLLRLKRLSHALESAHEVVHHIEARVIDVVIPDRLSYAVYRRAWRVGFKASMDLLPFEEYRKSRAREKAESALYSVLLIWFAWHGIVGAMKYGASLLDSAEATATAIKGIEIARGAKDATGILRGEL